MQDPRKIIVLLVLFATAAGCGSPDWVKSMNESFKLNRANDRESAEKHRREYEATQSRKSMRWLLAHCVDTGMTLDQVSNVMGVDGTREMNDRQYKSGGGYLIDDEMYSWKDAEGGAVILGFREGRLVNFDRADIH
jgi:hypothetical protein